jgi:glycine cleavage system H protein
MPEYFETTVDKFTFQVAKDRLYTEDGVWVLLIQAGATPLVRLGVTDFFQQHNGDVAFANVRPSETRLAPGDEFAEIETMKVTVGLPSPLSGTIAEVNEALVRTPELINQDPYDKGWLAAIAAEDWEPVRAKLLDPAAYLATMRSQAEQELK